LVPIFVSALLVGCSLMSDQRPAAGTMVIASGGTRGVYYAYAEALSRELTGRASQLKVRVVPTSGSVDNLRMVADGRATCAFTAADAAAAAYTGTAPFDSRLPITAIARVYDDYIHLVARGASPVYELADLRGRSVSVGPPGSGTALITDRVLGAAGMSRNSLHAEALGIDESIAALKRGRLDAFFWSGGVPTAGIEQLARQLPLRIVPLADSAQALRDDYGPVYHAAAIPAGPYGLVHQVATFAVPNFIVCRDGTRSALVRLLVSTIFQARGVIDAQVPAAAALDRRAAIETAPLPLDPAARQWFRETKI
jgi:TRAP transporter TAXI family solute receptor